jgi:hypothetical protein
MSLFGDDAREAAAGALYDMREEGGVRPPVSRWPPVDPDDADELRMEARAALDAAIAALDETELIEKAAEALQQCDLDFDYSVSEYKADARAVLVAIGLLPEETRP